MPYINCDGQTYSRYDTSPYVQACIEKEMIAYQKAYDDCTNDPICYAEIIRNQHVFDYIMTGFLITFIIGLIIIIHRSKDC